MRCYENERNQVIGRVQSALSKIHFTVDLWTSPNKLPLLGIIGHYIAESGNLCQSVLGLREIHGRHTGENQALVIMKVIAGFGIDTKLGYFMMDNATNNDTMIAGLSAMLLHEYNINYNAIHHRLCCNGHIINLVAQAVLFGYDKDAFSAESNPGIYTTPTELEMDLWRQKGPLGKLHDIVVFIQRSPQREETFLQLSHGRHLIRDQQTRWNSCYTMIDRAIQADIRIAIDLYCFQYKAEIQLDTLAPEEWAKLEHIHEVLQAFQEATLATEGQQVTLERVLPTMDYLLDHLEQQKIKYIGDAFITPRINLGWAKLNQYYTLTERSAVYTAAMILIPLQK
jgi:hypothetical protein